MRKLLLAAAIAFAGGCYTEADVSTGYGGGNPDLVEVDGTPGVQVVADAEYPVFYSDNAYWRYDGGIWYSSPYYGRGWVVSREVPVRVRGISNPGAYVHYRAAMARQHRTVTPVARGEVRGTTRVEPVRRTETIRRNEPVRRTEPTRVAPKTAPHPAHEEPVRERH